MNVTKWRSLFTQYLNELIFIWLFFKMVLFHYFSSTPISSGAISTSIGFLTIFYALSFFLKQKGRLIYSFIINLLVSIVLLSNALYLDYFSSPITFSVFYQTNNLSGLGDSILYFLKPQYLLFIVDLVLLPILLIRPYHFTSKKVRLKAAFSILLVGMALVILKPLKLVLIDHADSPIVAYDSKDLMVQYGIIGHHVLDGFFHIRDSQFKLSSEKRSHIAERLTDIHPAAAAGLDNKTDLAGIGKNKNLILIQVESLQQFVMNKQVNGQEITPTLNKLFKNSISFPHFYAQTIGGNSSDAEFLTQTSLFPLKTGSVFFRYPNNTYHSLPHDLKQNGYTTHAVHADERTFWNRHNMYPSLGFDRFIAIEDFPQNEIVGMGVGDKTMFSKMGDRLLEEKKPFYSFIVTLSNHMPYDLPDDKKTLTLPTELQNTLLGAYFQTVRYTDEALSIFINKLEKNGLLKDSMIVLYGDHNGIFYRDKGLLEKWLNKKISYEEWYREYATVPFMIYHPSIDGKVDETIGGQIDVMPTLRSVMGLKSDPRYVLGTNLFAKQTGEALIPSGGYVEEPLYITGDSIVRGLPKAQEDLLNLSNLIIKGDYFNANVKK
ncbi:LTA synthase family protein [Rossellomorea arthrocnemi]|uniref:LTA synthase family protein n=1 Tax=Rossellomorea arthrocnemi TaxID=2769542 RepID=UPI00191B87F8|nr:LTA synthase family protein [Rossellomorea arthrocnemi]